MTQVELSQRLLDLATEQYWLSFAQACLWGLIAPLCLAWFIYERRKKK